MAGASCGNTTAATSSDSGRRSGTGERSSSKLTSAGTTPTSLSSAKRTTEALSQELSPIALAFTFAFTSGRPPDSMCTSLEAAERPQSSLPRKAWRLGSESISARSWCEGCDWRGEYAREGCASRGKSMGPASVSASRSLLPSVSASSSSTRSLMLKSRESTSSSTGTESFSSVSDRRRTRSSSPGETCIVERACCGGPPLVFMDESGGTASGGTAVSVGAVFSSLMERRPASRSSL